MSNKKEKMAKSLGISEYPWSSDDDNENDNDEISRSEFRLLTLQNAENRTHNEQNSATSRNQSQPSYSGSAFASTSQRNVPKTDRNFFWSIINNHRFTMSRTPENRMQFSRSSLASNSRSKNPAERGLSSRDYQHMLALKRLSQTMRSIQQSKHESSIHSSPKGSSGPSRNPLFSPSLPRPIHTSRRKGHIFLTLNTPTGGSRNGPPISTSSQQEPRSSASSSNDSSVIVENSSTVSINGGSNEDRSAVGDVFAEEMETEDGANITSISLEEEIVEIKTDAPAVTTDGNELEANSEEIQENGNEEILSEAVPVADELKRVKRKHETIPENGESGEPQSVKEFNQNLLRLLECPVCLEWMEPPMAQCRRGHIVCSRCRTKLNCCPICRTIFSSVRNRAMEGVAELVRYPCRHACGSEVRLRARTGHEASCAQRRYACPAPCCSDAPQGSGPAPPAAPAAARHTMLRDQLSAHLHKQHPAMVRQGSKQKFSVNLNTELLDICVIFALKEMFHARVAVDIHTWNLLVYVAYIGPVCNANNYKYEVSIKGEHNSRSLSYTRETHNDLESASVNVSRQDCFHMGIDQAVNYLRYNNRHCEPDKTLELHVEITPNLAAEKATDS